MENNILDQNISYRDHNGTAADIRPNGDRAKTAVITLFIILLFQFLFMIGSPMAEGMVDPYGSQDELLRNAMILLGLAFVFLIINIITIVMFIRWFRRAYFNLHMIDNRYLSHTEGWAAGAWFVPIMNFFWPLGIMKEICKETEVHAERITGRSQRSALPLVGWWWGTWIAPWVIGIVTNFSSDKEIILILNTLNYLLNIVCGMIVIIIIKRVSVMEKAVYENRERAGLQAVPGYAGPY